MTTLREYTTTEARDQFADLVGKATYGAERSVVTKRGKKVAALVPIADLQVLNELERLVDFEEARAALAETETVGATTLEDLKKELGI